MAIPFILMVIALLLACIGCVEYAHRRTRNAIAILILSATVALIGAAIIDERNGVLTDVKHVLSYSVS